MMSLAAGFRFRLPILLSIAIAAGQSTGHSQPGYVEKPGNNGSVSCNVFCTNTGGNWGPAGKCVGSRIESGPRKGQSLGCDDGLGELGNVTCFCQPPQPPGSDSFEKPGDNGTASCNTFCTNTGGNWGPAGTCTGGRVEQGYGAGGNLSCTTVPTAISGSLASVVCYCKPSLRYAGCYQDFTDGVKRKLPDQISASSTMTVEQCVAAAINKGYQYAGLQAGGQCYGGNTISAGDLAAIQADCADRCNSDPTEICGGGWRNSVYYAKADSRVPHVYLGCYLDNKPVRMLPVVLSSSSTMTIETCLTAVQAKGLAYAGLQFQGQCYGGNTLTGAAKAPFDSECNTPCNANKNETCGGAWFNSVYLSGAPVPSCAFDKDLTSDNYNCGSCGHVCGAGSKCIASQCVPDCGSHTKCGNSCIDTTSNSSNCGACGHSCGANAVCKNSQCVPSTICSSGLSQCGSSCVNFKNDSANCGGCGNRCASGSTCQNSSCVSSGVSCGGSKCGAGQYCCQNGCRQSGVGSCPNQGNKCEFYCPAGTSPCAGTGSSAVNSCCNAYSGAIVSSPGPCR